MTDTTYLIDSYVITKAGQPYRLFPFGVIYKNGKRREITPEYASRFKLPHFKPPIKLGSHDDPTPAGGHIVGLEVRDDGLYVVPEWNEQGESSNAKGSYRYHSPEVIWDDGAIENPQDGSMINGPLVLGDALLHTPHLGEATAFYSIEPTTEESEMEENITLPRSFYDKFIAPLFAKEPEVKTVEVVKEPEDYAATKQERDELKARIEAQNAENVRTELLGSLVRQLQNKDDFGMNYVELKAAEEAASMMAGMTQEQREWCMRNFKALVAQINESNLTGERGKDGPGQDATGDPKLDFNNIVTNLANEKKINYNAAFEQVKTTHPDLFKAAFPKK